MKLGEIADAIGVHLRRFEADPKINVSYKTDKSISTGLHPYYQTGTYAAGRFVMVTYVTYQGADSLTKDAALKYLAWLDAGNVGTHRDALTKESRP
jgi:hypothetical protein